MAPSRSADRALSVEERDLLLDIADAAIVDGLRGRRPSAPALALVPEALRDPSGVFVTLNVDGLLNGCIGNIDGVEPLAHGAARHAWAAAFTDPRLPALRPHDYDRLLIEVSVLSPLTPIPATSWPDVHEQLETGTDGLVVAAGSRQGVFLPAVWDQLPDRDAFLDHLWLKAGLRPRDWPVGTRAWRFGATKFARRAGQTPSSQVA